MSYNMKIGKMKSCNHFWMYATIACVYFLLIGIVILILLLAPKYPSFSEYSWYPKETQNFERTGSNNIDLDVSYDVAGVVVANKESKDPIVIPSRRAPVYDIDPRSGLSSGDIHPESTSSEPSGSKKLDQHGSADLSLQKVNVENVLHNRTNI